MNKKCILILGGARGGKSQFAQDLAGKLGDKVLFVATGQAYDEEMHVRIENHKNSRPTSWRTLEALMGVSERIKENIGDAEVVLVDCITMLVSNVLADNGACENKEKDIISEIEDLLECVDSVDAVFIIVSNEVGLGIVPENKLARYYRDYLGRANQLLAQKADEVYLLVAGLPVELKALTVRNDQQ